MNTISNSNRNTNRRLGAVSPVTVSIPRVGTENVCKFSFKKAVKSKSKFLKVKNLREAHSLERSFDQTSPGTSMIRAIQTLQSNIKSPKANNRKATGRGIVQPNFKFLTKVKQNTTSNLKGFKSETRLTTNSNHLWMHDSSKLVTKNSDKKKLGLLSSPLCSRKIKSPFSKQQEEASTFSKPTKYASKLMSSNKLLQEDGEPKTSKGKTKKQQLIYKAVTNVANIAQPKLELGEICTTLSKDKTKRQNSEPRSHLKNKKSKGKKLCGKKKDKPSEVFFEPQQLNFLIQPPKQLQRHYLLNRAAYVKESFSDSSLQTDDQRRTIKIGAVEKLRDLEKSIAQDRTRKRFKISDSRERGVGANEGSSENELVAETIQNFYRDWNSNIKEEKEESPDCSPERQPQECSKAEHEQVKISFGGVDTPLYQLGTSLSSVLDKDISLCLSHSKYDNRKVEAADDQRPLERHKAVLVQQKKETLVKLHQKPEVLRSIYKLVTFVKKPKSNTAKIVEDKNTSQSREMKLLVGTNKPKGPYQPKTTPVLQSEQSAKVERLEKKKKTSFIPKINLQNWNNFAKEEYNKWNKVTNLLHVIEDKIGSKAAEDVVKLFKQLESFAEHSKKNLKEVFMPAETGMSNTFSEIGTLRQDSSFKGNSFFERKKALKKVVPTEPLPSSGTNNPKPNFEKKLDKDEVEGSHLSRSGIDYKRKLENITMEKWVNPPNLMRSSVSANILEKQIGSM